MPIGCGGARHCLRVRAIGIAATRRVGQFPANREFCREFSRFRPRFGAFRGKFVSKFKLLNANSLLAREQGINCARAGNFLARAGNCRECRADDAGERRHAVGRGHEPLPSWTNISRPSLNWQDDQIARRRGYHPENLNKSPFYLGRLCVSATDDSRRVARARLLEVATNRPRP